MALYRLLSPPYSQLSLLSALCRAAPILLALLACGSPIAFADEVQPRLSGFGTIGYTGDSRSELAPIRDVSQRPVKLNRTGASALVDSRLGLQLEFALTPDIDLVGQIVVRDHFKASADNSVELGYAMFRPATNLDLRVGIVGFDAFLMADHRHTGHAYTWVRPPSEFYGWLPIFSVNGGDVTYTFRAKDAQWRIKGQVGSSDAELPIGNGYHSKTSNVRAVSISRQSDTLRLKAAYSWFTVDSEVPSLVPLQAGLDRIAAAGLALSPEAADLRKNLSFQYNKVTYVALGAAYDDGVWQAQAELGRTTATAKMLPNGDMAYGSIGRRFGAWTPFVMLAASRPGNKVRAAENDWSGIGQNSTRDSALFAINATRIEQSTISAGVRWDFHAQAALKVQIDRTRIKRFGYGLWFHDGLLDQPRSVHRLTATLDFTF